MIRNKQTIVDGKYGDCMRACLTSMLDLPNDDFFPSLKEEDWMHQWFKILNSWGLELAVEHKAMWKTGYWMASVPSLNFEGVSHAIVMKDHEVWHDPSTKKQYEQGVSLLGGGLVTQCSFIRVADASKLWRYVEHKNNVWKS